MLRMLEIGLGLARTSEMAEISVTENSLGRLDDRDRDETEISNIYAFKRAGRFPMTSASRILGTTKTAFQCGLTLRLFRLFIIA